MNDAALWRDDIATLQIACIVARERVRIADEMLARAQRRRRHEERAQHAARRRERWWAIADELPAWLGSLHQ